MRTAGGAPAKGTGVTLKPRGKAWRTLAAPAALGLIPITMRGRSRWGNPRAYPPFCIDTGSMPIKMLAAQIRPFCRLPGLARSRCR